ncbi:MAG: hypothetical protein HXY46_13500 [Syntrophaceae bacterium]|nr:hypothetical protein [Syntrophaceae bacterium]
MERRRFVENFVMAVTLAGLLLLTGCAKKEREAGFGNQDRLWQLIRAESKTEEPVDLVYAKDTPVLYRDASMGKADPSFVPKIGGG